ncbi:MAG: nuclease-related domain-containing protein [Candidatus Cryosericum sp.]
MAVIVGESGAWKQVRQLAWQAGIIVEQPADIPVQLAKARQALLQQDTLARDDLAVQQADLERKLADQRASSDRDIAAIRARCDEDLARLARRPWTSILRSTRQAQAQRQIRRRLQPVLLAERALEDFTAHEETEVARRVEAAHKVALGIEAVANSQELAGAVAELDVIRTLSALPDDYALLNDVHLAAKRPIPYEGGTIVTGQLNHLLIGPTGVYAIETRNWSKAVLTSGEHVDPVKQVKRSSALCRSILKDAGVSPSVNAIIACAGAMPESPAGEQVAVMPIARLPSYVQHAVPQLSVEDALRIRRILT